MEFRATPKCPKCPYGKDDNVIVSNVKPGFWYCHGCGSYYDKIAGVSPPTPTVKTTVVLETDEALRWAIEEIATASDRALAQFYALINSMDRWIFKNIHIDINGDFREETPTIEPYDGTK
jgi:ribosomal protein L37AE/L43A